MSSWENPLEAQTSVQKSQYFSTADQSYETWSFTFQFLAGLGVYVQLFMLEPCQIANRHIFGHSRSNII